MSRRALAGGYGSAQKDGSKRSRTTPAPPDPRDFALAVMRDESQPMALRAQMAKAAASWAYKRGEEMEAEEKPQQRKYSDLELARRIARIMELGRQQAKREGKPFPEIGDEDIAPEPVPGGRLPGGPPDWENSRAVVHPPLLPPSEAGRVPSASEAGGVLHAPTPPGRSFHSRPPSPLQGEGEQESQIRPKPVPPKPAMPAWADDEREQQSDVLDPHPGYRWIR